jgi:RNA polymerase sigma-70 factor (ECF subfamily)
VRDPLRPANGRLAVAATASGATSTLEDVYREHGRYIWGLCYRMTGAATDADDLVQETFARALASPPPDTTAPWRPWLVRVAMNLARDRLRRRKRAPYVGPWLPSPVETDEASDAAPDGQLDPEHRYGLLESVSFAFLLACEALTPRQRAVLLLRDVLDYSVEEAARALALSEANVRTTHHRARAAMEAYDAARRPPSAALRDETRAALEGFMAALATGDVGQVEALLAPDASTTNDTNGDYRAALNVVTGRNRVARFFLGLMKKVPPGRIECRPVNGLPAYVVTVPEPPPRVAPRIVFRCELAADGRIQQIHVVVAKAKLQALSA